MRWRLSKTTVEAKPYSGLARVYDHLMRHVNYVRWGSYVADLFSLAEPEGNAFAGTVPRKFLPGVQHLVELACGTGKMMVELAKSGFNVLGIDHSPDMLRVARRRLRALDLPGKLVCGDMRHLCAAMEADVVICLYDSVNYCQREEDLHDLFTEVSRLVRPGGIFIFDVCTQRNCRRNFRNFMENESVGRFSYTRHSYYKPQRRLQINEFLIVDESRPDELIREQHVQRIYSLKELRAVFAGGPWHEAGCYNGMSKQPGSERSDRVHFVLRRK